MDSYFKKQLMIAAVPYLGQLAVGYNAGWTAPIIPKLQNPDETPLPQPLTDEQASWFASVLFIGVIIGSSPYVLGYISNTKGRKTSFYVSGVLITVALLMMIVPPNFVVLMIGRVISGMGFGMTFSMNYLYLGEIASPNVRGMFLTGTMVFLTLGTLLSYSVGPYVSYSASIGVVLAIVLMYTATVYFIPESPLFRIMQGKEKEASDILTSLGRSQEITEFAAAQLITSEKGNWRELYRVKSNRRATVITLTLTVLQQLSGVSIVLLFATTIFELAESTIDANVSTIIIGATQVLASATTPFFVERVGRRILLLVSTLMSSISLTTLGVFFYLDAIESPVAGRVHWLPLTAMVSFFISYNLGFAMIPMTLIGEMFESNMRSIGTSIAMTIGRIFTFIVATTFGYIISSIGVYFAFWLFAVSCGAAFVFSIFFVPETKGKTLFEIQYMLSK